MVVNGEWALRPEEDWYVCVVGLANRLTVESLLNEFSNVSEIRLNMANIIHFIIFWIFTQLRCFAR